MNFSAKLSENNINGVADFTAGRGLHPALKNLSILMNAIKSVYLCAKLLKI